MAVELQSKLRRLVRKVRLGHELAHAATSVLFFAAFVGEKAPAGHTAFVDGPIRFIPPLPEEISPAAEENLDLVHTELQALPHACFGDVGRGGAKPIPSSPYWPSCKCLGQRPS